ncbi:hypothetical protein RJ639_005739, partial [Escallonia herrerae]
DTKNSLDSAACRDVPLNYFVKPPANLVVLEGDCLDAIGDGGELESYLLATNDVYRDFILLDSCDSGAVNDFLDGDDKAGNWQSGVSRGSFLPSKSRKNFLSPTKRSGGSGIKSSSRKNQDSNLNQSPPGDHGFEFDGCNAKSYPSDCNVPESNNVQFEMDDGYSEPGDLDDDDDDPWKPLNPHEPGNLKVKPFKKGCLGFSFLSSTLLLYFIMQLISRLSSFCLLAVTACRREVGISSSRRINIIKEFPLARLHGTISSELTEIWETQCRVTERQQESHSPPLYEKLRQSLVLGLRENFDAFSSPKDKEDNGYDSDGLNFDMPESAYMDEDIALQHDKHDDGGPHFDTNETYGNEDQSSQANLEDLCRSHLDSLLASIAETEKQTELAARVSTWKQRIEQNLEEQDSHQPFDIHEYGERVLDKLSLDADSGNPMSFVDVARCQEKHDVARTFSALLQLVNNGNVDLERGGADGESTCYTAMNPFYVRLCRHVKRREAVQLRSAKKRAKSPIMSKGYCRVERGNSGKENRPVISSSAIGSTSMGMTPQTNCKFSPKLGKVGGVRCTPEGKRRRRSLRGVGPVNLQSSG